MNSTINNEVWYQDTENHDLWSNDGGLLVNTAALDEREAYFDVTRVDANAVQLDGSHQHSSSL